MSNTLALIQARMSSHRLPGKVLAKIGDRTMLDHVVRRLRHARSLDRVVVATSNLPQDQIIVDHCRTHAIECVIGSHDDVLSRFAVAAATYDAGIVVRITADCPLIDASVVDRVVGVLKSATAPDYVCNFFPRRTFPRGLDVEAMRRDVLERVHDLARDPRHREHVTLFIYENPDAFHIESVQSELDHSDLRWTVDEPSDLELVREVYSAFQGNAGTWQEIIRAYDRHPRWRSLNANVAQKVA